MLGSGSVLLMKGDVQEHYEHCLPLQKGDDNLKEGNPLRISLTCFVPSFQALRMIEKSPRMAVAWYMKKMT
eukprot:scaffold17079_cov124-Cylindrotheca_fusiformis.AAC.1